MSAAARFARFLATGALNTAFGYGIYALLVALGVPYLAALVAATAAGLVFNYFTFGKLAFRAAVGRAGFARYLAGYGVALAFNAALLWLARGVLGLDPYVAQLACLPPTVGVTYLVLDNWVYATARPHVS